MVFSKKVYNLAGYIGRASNGEISKKYRENVINNITKHIENEQHNCRSKNGFRGVFSRVRKISYIILIVMLLRLNKKAIQRELDSFYKELSGSEFNIRNVTKGAFTQARAKLEFEVFVGMNKKLVETFYNEAPYLVWHEMRLLAVDGTRLILPNHESVIKDFGLHGFGPNADSKKSLAMASILYDPLNLITIDAQLDAYSSSEKELLHKHISLLEKGDLLLADRGYPSIAIFFLLMAKGIEYCFRMKEDWWLLVKEFRESGKHECIVEFELPKKDRTLLNDYPQLENKIKSRLIRIDLADGTTEILCTSLIDTEKYKWEDFEELYHFRWGIEEGYKLLKARVEIEAFSGKTSLSVKQDFHSKIFMMSLSSVLAFPIEEKLREEWENSKKEEEISKKQQEEKVKEQQEEKVKEQIIPINKKRKYQQKINRTNALAMTQNICIGLFLKGLLRDAINAFDDIVAKTTEIVRPNRKNPRNKKPKKLYYMNYKQL